MNIQSDTLFDILSRAKLVLNLRREVENPDHKLAYIRTTEDMLSITVTDRAFYATIWAPIADGVEWDGLVDIQRLAAWTGYIDGVIELRPRKATMLAKCGMSECAASISAGLFVTPKIEDEVGHITLTEKQLKILDLTRNQDSKAIEKFKNISMVHGEGGYAAASDGFMHAIVGNTYEYRAERTHRLLPPNYMSVAMKILKEDRTTLSLCGRSLIHARSATGSVIFPDTDGNEIEPMVVDALHSQPLHTFRVGAIKGAVSAMVNTVKEPYVWVVIEPDETGWFVLKHRDSTLSFPAFPRESGGEWNTTACFNAVYMNTAMSVLDNSAEMWLVPHSRVEGVSSMILVDDPIRVGIGPGLAKKRSQE